MSTAPVIIHCADAVLPVEAPPIRSGAVAVADGLILAVGTEHDIVDRFGTGHPETGIARWTGALVPGLVNAHTHLQYTSFHDVGAQPFSDYTAWSVRFVDEYDTRADDDWEASARRGAESMLAAGITCIADVVTDFVARDVLSSMGIPGVAYLELIGVDETSWNAGQADRLRAAVVDAPTTASTRVGISPHAPYSVDGPALRAMSELARDLGVRLHIHVAESDGEDEFYRTGTGPLAERVRVVATRRVSVLEQGGTSLGTAEYVASLGILGPSCHIAHGVYLGASGRRIVADAGTIVALCPRSNITVGIDPPPVADYLREHIRFAVGTDSLGSTPSLDLMADVALLYDLARHDGYDDADLAPRLIRAATSEGARALGLDDQLGSLAPGMRADMAVFDVDCGGDVETAFVTTGAGHCTATIIAGELRHRAPDA